MRFEGKINTRHYIDYAAYRADRHRFKYKIVLMEDYLMEGRGYFTADVYARVGERGCLGQHLASIIEHPKAPEIPMELEISTALIERLRNDGETSEDNLKKLIWILANKEVVT